MGAKRLGYVRRLGGKRPGVKRLGGETSCYLTPYTVKETRPFSCIAVAAIFTCKSFVLLNVTYLALDGMFPSEFR